MVTLPVKKVAGFSFHHDSTQIAISGLDDESQRDMSLLVLQRDTTKEREKREERQETLEKEKDKEEKKDPGFFAKLLNFIWENFNMLPFALRWITKEWEEKEARELLDILIKKKAVQAYPVLIEVNEQRVAQAEHTFIPSESGVTVTTKALE